MVHEIKLSQQARERFSQRGRHQRTEQAAGQEQTAAKDKNSGALMAEMQQNPYFQIVYSTALSDPEKLATLKQRLKYDLEKNGAETRSRSKPASRKSSPILKKAETASWSSTISRTSWTAWKTTTAMA